MIDKLKSFSPPLTSPVRGGVVGPLERVEVYPVYPFRPGAD